MLIEVVAVATPKGLIRSIRKPWGKYPKEAIDQLVNAIGVLNLQETEWTGMYYRFPDYLPRPDVEVGIWMWPWVTNQAVYKDDPDYISDGWDMESIWNDPRKRWTIARHKELLWKPNGW